MFITTVCVLLFESKKVLDSGFHVMDSVIRVLNSEFFVNGTWILDVIGDSGVLEMYFGFQSPVFRILQAKFPDSGIQIPLHWALPSFVACLAGAWKKWAQKKNGRARGRHACLFRAHYFLPPLPHANPSITQPWQYSAALFLKRTVEEYPKFLPFGKLLLAN